ncbi:MAG: hypothetical protein KDA24_12020 [Deltaproteobacteria bacterium]|nr:hypothetical protein [Deltaproteobacteria bacterium]
MKQRLALSGVLALLMAWAAPAAAQQLQGNDTESKQPLWTKRKKPKGLRYGGTAFATMAPDLRMAGPYEDKFELRAGVDFRVRYKFAPTAQFQIAAKARYHLRVGDRVEADFLLNLGDTWLQFRHKKVTVRAGIETMKWGQNALLSVLDRLNPSDFTLALGGSGQDDPKIALPAVRATFNLNPVAIELVYLPIFRPQRSAIYGRDFAALRPGMLEESLPGLFPSTSSAALNQQQEGLAESLVDRLIATDAYARDGLQSYLVADLPEEFPWHGDFGARFGYTGRGFDVNAYALWHVVDRPAVTIHEALRRPMLQNRYPNSNELTILGNPGTELTTTEYKRGLMAGADIAVAVGDFVISAEGGFFTNSVHYRKTLEPYRSPMVRYAVEARWTPGSNFALSLGGEHDIIITPAADTLLERQNNVSLLMLAVVRIFRERIQILAGVNYNPIWQDFYAHPRISIELQDRLTAVFGLQIYESFRPDVDNSLDGFLSYTGGPLGYFRGNDYAYGMVKLAF